MQPAAEAMAEAPGRGHHRLPRAPLVANITARPDSDPETIRRLLVQQVTGRVPLARDACHGWPERAGDRFAEAGAGKVLTGMVKRIAPDAQASRP